MPTPTERLEARKCKVCTWLSTLAPADAREWRKAINNPRFGTDLVAQEASLDGADFGREALAGHRQRGHE